MPLNLMAADAKGQWRLQVLPVVEQCMFRRIKVHSAGGKDKAKPLFEKAIALFKTDKPKPFWPNWGLESTEEQLAKCQ